MGIPIEEDGRTSCMSCAVDIGVAPDEVFE